MPARRRYFFHREIFPVSCNDAYRRSDVKSGRSVADQLDCEAMDKVRFGRALGTGAREAARALLRAADAAAAPDPNPMQRPAVHPVVESPVRREVELPPERPVTNPAPIAQVVQRAAVARAKAKVTGAGLKRGGKRFGEAAWGPFARAGGVLWLEVTGVLFGLIAFAAGVAVWHDRSNFFVGGKAQHHAWFGAGMFALFAYFTVSSYVRAGRRGKR
jgi:hypothetical protein